jgi:hypothetical protein
MIIAAHMQLFHGESETVKPLSDDKYFDFIGCSSKGEAHNQHRVKCVCGKTFTSSEDYENHFKDKD